MIRRNILSATLIWALFVNSALGALVDSAFDPNQLVPDAVFPDTKTFGGSDGIQKFLESHGSILADTSPDSIARLREPDDGALKKKLDDPRPSRLEKRTAAQLIWDASQASGLNPQVILVTLNKEQGLITQKIPQERLQRALDHAMGFACPDNSPCDRELAGFYFQLFGAVDGNEDRYLGAARSLMKSFRTPGGRGPYYKGKIAGIGDIIELENTLGGFEGVEERQKVTIKNSATAALYRYTPHVFNGNYNFWRFFTAWFQYPGGTLLKDVDTGIVYVLKKGTRVQVPSFVARSRKMSLRDALRASPRELSEYPLGEVLQPLENTVVRRKGKKYLFFEGVRRPVSDIVLRQLKVKQKKPIRISEKEEKLFERGPVLVPKNGTLLHVQGTAKRYLVADGSLKILSDVTLEQYAAGKHANAITAAEREDLPISGFMPPRDGTLVRGKKDRMMYFVDEGARRPAPRALFVNNRFKMSQVATLSDPELLALPLGKHILPREGSYFKVRETGETFIVEGEVIRPISAKALKKRRVKVRTSFEMKVAQDWPRGGPIPK